MAGTELLTTQRLRSAVAALIGVAVVASAAASRAEIMVAPTLEWLADHCIDSGVYRVARVDKKPNLNRVYEITLQRSKPLRGKPTSQVRETYSAQTPPREKRKRPAVRVGDEFLVCFQHYEKGQRRVVQLINLSNPQKRGYNTIAVTSKLELLRDGKRIRRLFEQRLKSHPKGDPVLIHDYSKDNRFELDFDSDVYQAIYSGSSCFVRIPSDLVGKQGPVGAQAPD